MSDKFECRSCFARWFHAEIDLVKIFTVAAVLSLGACSGGSPPSPPSSQPIVISMDPTRWAFQYSPNISAPGYAQDGWSFVFPIQDGAHYLVTGVSGYARGTITARYTLKELSGNPVTWEWNRANNPCDYGAHASLYFQKRGDDFTDKNPSGRFFQKTWTRLEGLGTLSMTVPLDPDHWTNILNQADPAGFAATTADLQTVGITFGGGCFAGHGLWTSSGTVLFTMESYKME